MRDLVWVFDEVIIKGRNPKICHVHAVFDLRIEEAQIITEAKGFRNGNTRRDRAR